MNTFCTVKNFMFFLSFCGAQHKNNDEKEPLEPLTYVSTLDVVYQWFRDFFFSFFLAMQSSFSSVLYLHLTSNSFASCFRNFLRWLFRTLFVILIWSVAHKHLFILIFLHLMQHNGRQRFQYCKCSLAWLN